MKRVSIVIGMVAVAAGLLLGGCATTVKEPAEAPAAAVNDDQLAQTIRRQLQAEQLTSVSVTVRAGRVTLDGTVPNAGARMRAVGIARATAGVQDVVDNIRSW